MIKKRMSGIDIFRGYAIVLMIMFHFSFDLNNFHILTLDLSHDNFWIYARLFILSMFIFSVGISLKLAHPKQILFKKVKKRVLILGIASLAVTLGSYTQFPSSWIYFGVLHFVLFSSIAGLAFLNVPKIALATSALIFVGYFSNLLQMHWLFDIVKEPLHLPLNYTEDLVTIFPWFGVVLLGIAFAGFNLHSKIFDNNFFNADTKINNAFSFLGKNSLVIYLVHQPILFGLFMVCQ